MLGNPELDYFGQFPERRYIEPCSTLLKNEPEEASRIMWSISLLEDPDSEFYRLPYEERKKEIELNYLKSESFDWDKYQNIIDAYPRVFLSKEKYMFKIWSDKLDELTSHLKKLKFDDEKQSIKALKIMEKMKPIWEGYEKVKTKMVEEESKSNLRGGAKRSAREQRNSS